MGRLRLRIMAPSPPPSNPGWVGGVGQVAQVVAAAAVLAIAGMVFTMKLDLTEGLTELRNCVKIIGDHAERIKELEKGQAEIRAVINHQRQP